MIPAFDHNYVIPPYIGSPVKPSDLSPYTCTSVEFCEKFSTSVERIEILKGFLRFRKRMNEIGIIKGFQWIDGSFTEDIENRESRPPNDLDLVTFYIGLSPSVIDDIKVNFKEFISPSLSKTTYKLDHYPVDYGYNPDTTVESTKYWLQLFSHNRLSVWKGILRIELSTPDIDEEALDFLNSI